MNSSLRDSRSAGELRLTTQARPLELTLTALLLVCFAICFTCQSFAAEPNLLLNGDLSEGSGDMPAHWSRAQFASHKWFRWSHPTGEPASLEVERVKSKVRHTSYWSQSVNLSEAGWYRLRAEVMTDNPDTSAVLKLDGAHDLKVATQSNPQWGPMEVYFKISGPETVQIGCGVRAEPAGRALFRNLELHRIAGAPPSAALQFDMSGTSELSREERIALRNVDLAKSPPDASLLRDILGLPALAGLLFIFAMLTLLDRRYAGALVLTRELRAYLDDPQCRKSAGVAALLCLMLIGTWLVTRLEYLPGHGLYVVEPHAVGGDEPHYLVMTNSILRQHNLKVETMYNDVDQGGPEAGVLARGVKLDRQTILVNRRTGGRIMESEWKPDIDKEFQPSPDLYEIPMHPAGFPLMLAAAIAPMRPHPREVEAYAGFVLMLIAWLGVVATYFVGRQVGMGRGWAMIAAAILFAASPWLAYSRAYFAESAIGTALVFGLWALMADFPIVAALAAAAGATMKVPFALAGAGFLLEEVREKRWKSALKIAMVLGVPALEIFAYNFWLHRSALTLGVVWAFHFGELWRTLMGLNGGLFLYVPWTVFGFLACARAQVSQSPDMRLARTIGFAVFVYLLVLSSVGFGGGYCFGPRYWIAYLPWLALATVEALRKARPYQRAACAILIAFALALAIPGALRYPQLFRKPALAAWRGFD